MESFNCPTFHNLVLDFLGNGLYASLDPLPEHFEAAREIIEDDIKDNENSFLKYIDTGVDLLARELVQACSSFKTEIEALETSNFNQIAQNVISHEIEGMLWIDAIFFNFFGKLGPVSEEEANLQREVSKGKWLKWRYSKDENAGSKIWSMWSLSDSGGKISSIAPEFLYILAYGLWNDKIKRKWEKQVKNTPALTKATLITTIKPVLLKNSKIDVKDSTIVCYSNTGKVISTVPFFDPKLVNLICKGMKCLSTLNGHRLIRWQVKTGFYQWLNEVEDPRLIRTSGGYEGIAHLIGGGHSHKGISEVKAMLHAQAYGQFEFPQGGSGNMIILSEIEKHKNGEPSKINLLLGEFLFPNFTHFLPCGEKRRLVPIIDLPPLIGSKNTHAAQAMLQLLILEEFSKQSDWFAVHGSILLSKEKLQEFCAEAKLPQTSLQKVISGWIQGDNFSKPFLRVKGNEYALSHEHTIVSDFLEQQGYLRINGAERGKKAALRKRKNGRK